MTNNNQQTQFKPTEAGRSIGADEPLFRTTAGVGSHFRVLRKRFFAVAHRLPYAQ